MTIALLVLLALMGVGAAFALLRPGAPIDGACPSCSHACGQVDNRHCAAVDDVSGMASTPCVCTNEYHWHSDSRHPATYGVA